MKKRILNVVLWTIGIAASFILITTISVYSFLNYYLVPKMTGMRLSDLGIGIMDIVDTITDAQVMDNIMNFDKQSAVEIMQAVTELDHEINDTEMTNTEENNTQDDPETPETIVETPSENTKNPDIKEDSPKAPEKSNENPQNETDLSGPIDTKGAYQRIMNTASKEEISQGKAIISKVDMSKVNALRKSGDTSQVKAYVKSVLTPGEISTAVTLYNKYKHLL